MIIQRISNIEWEFVGRISDKDGNPFKFKSFLGANS